MKDTALNGLSDTFEILRDSVVCPLDLENRCGVLRSDGSFSEFSRIRFGPNQSTKVPQMPDAPAKKLGGRHLFGGWLRPHFGHFLMESTPRVWALDGLECNVESIVFIPFKRGKPKRVRAKFKPLLDILTSGIDVGIIDTPTQVEELIVPDPGFGHGERILGSSRYRDVVRKRVAATVSPYGSERLYISRTGLDDNFGGVFGEDRLEDLMRNSGYAIFRPEQHCAEEQLARYRAAREIVCLDGSALHMVAFAAKKGARIGIVFRRRSHLLEGLIRHLQSFLDAEVFGFDALRNSWVDQKSRWASYRSVGELDFPKLSQQLKRAGFIEAGNEIPDLEPHEIATMISAMNRGPMNPT